MVTSSSRDFFAAIAESGATLTGLLFVAMSIGPRRKLTTHAAVVQQVRAAAALLAFTTALTISLWGLVEGNNVGYPAVVCAVIGLFFTAAGMRSIIGSTRQRHLILRQAGLFVLLLTTFGFELGTGAALIANRRSTSALEGLSDVLIVSLLIGVARAWELVGERETSLFSSIAVLTGRSHTSPARPEEAIADTDPSASSEELPRSDGP